MAQKQVVVEMSGGFEWKLCNSQLCKLTVQRDAEQTTFTYKQKCGCWGAKDKNVSPNIQIPHRIDTVVC